MPARRKDNAKLWVLLSEGSSTNVREMITALGPMGYTIDICDPNPWCIGRFSKYIRKVYPCPRSGDDPVGYLRCVIGLLKQNRYDVLFPANEQAFLFAWARKTLEPLTGIAVSDFSAFVRLQTKSAFIRLLDEIGLSHPRTLLAKSRDAIHRAVHELGMPCYIKTDYGTASTGVWRMESDHDLRLWEERFEERLTEPGESNILVQEAAKGVFEQLHSIFDHGKLIAVHCTRRLLEGVGGGAIVKQKVDCPAVRRDIETIGAALMWHGSLSMDYFYDEADGKAYYIDANPRITEPMNAVANGVNLADMQLGLSLGESILAPQTDAAIRKSHSAIQALLAAAGRRHTRRDILRELWQAATGSGVYANSSEGVTPVMKDFPAVVPLAVVLFSLLLNPQSGQTLARKTISDYSLGAAIPKIEKMNPDMFFGTRADAVEAVTAGGANR